MAQPSVAREPSMEEILASIRRIIESNDPLNGGSLSQDVSALSDDYEQSEEDNGYDGGDFVAANDAGSAFPVFQREIERAEVMPAEEPARDPAAEAPKSVSLADLAARVRSASERMERPVQSSAPTISSTPIQATVVQPRRDMPQAAEQQARAAAPVMATRLSEMRDQQLRPALSPEPAPYAMQRAAAEAEHPADPAPMARIASVEVRVERQEPRFVEAAFEPTYEELEPEMQASPSSVELQRETESEGRDLTALVSAATVEQVSRSFSDLAAAFDGTERRSLDEMAEDMLRPMLKDWLDDNLPTLVERLVREEIERVARGPRR
ncbi:cell pole-organizing protein PopZ [Peteryoungia aggregata LMG 23059]|uniref:Cell pole-organizing protein PopZ n=1 Tax=Peteryoungia aggregata LMG 23059 TaxID=1368425 RepID=A0ABU0G6R1_9HYPH|nr:DUF2497 domain-containing protein [Peteryoungia aggregata]MDQ0421002.1 cell pole-organizing protein PopZ [Peteryoungia aggregata LMG 23059]